MGTFSRIRYVIAANMNALLEKAEDPEKLLRALIREMEDAGEDARLAAADLLAEQQHLERVVKRLEREESEWTDRAEQAVAADRDDLARAALKAKAETVERLAAARHEQSGLRERLAQLETDMGTLKAKLAEAKGKLKQMHTRERVRSSAPAPAEEKLSHHERKLRNAMGRFDRLQSQVERLEARVRSYEVGEAAPSPWEAGPAPSDPAVEAELEALKARVGKPAVAADADAEAPQKEPAADAGPDAATPRSA
ncbi:MAG: PspA/IM30 family protein [Xanthomonadales bacterium]|jgi:phage shock protein A|nr:PspA/IM30 family protein [Xanthomonadales bacterium]